MPGSSQAQPFKAGHHRRKSLLTSTRKLDDDGSLQINHFALAIEN
jgi:hypothetical protein